MNRLLADLDAAIAGTQFPRELPFLRAERASVLARLGHLDEARDEVAALRRLPDEAGHPVLQAWLWLTEGLIDFFSDINLRARECARKAQACAEAGKAPRVQALAAAWGAHFDFRAQDYGGMVRQLATALHLAGFEHTGAHARACLVAAGAWHFAGHEDRAQPWYRLARRHAAVDGDGAMLSAIVFNMSVFRLIDMRLKEVAGHCTVADVRAVLLGSESSLSLDQRNRNRAWMNHPPILRAQALTVLGDHAAALELYDGYLGRALSEGLDNSEALYQADRAFCLVRLGHNDEAWAAARRAEALMSRLTEPEEPVIAQAMLARVWAELGTEAEALSSLEAARRLHDAFRGCQGRLARMLEDADLEGHLQAMQAASSGGEALPGAPE